MPIEVGRFHDLHEAELAAALLRSAGIRAEVADHHLIGMDPLMQRAVGGLRVMAPDDEAADARAILARVQAGELVSDVPDDLPSAAGAPGRDASLALGVLAAPWAVAGMLGARRSVSVRRRFAPLAIILLVSLLVGLPLVLRIMA
ncbi:MAG: putative signal transducing protein [Brevundimonas sp.]